MNNPLASLYRTAKTYVSLPSKGMFYDDKVLTLSSLNGEIGIKPMTGHDEMMFKNPDALINGQAMTTILMNCVDGLHDPKQLVVNDVDAIIVAIRIATYGDEMDIKVGCPSCKEESTYGLDLGSILANINYMEDVNTVDLSNGTIVYLKPQTYNDTLKASLATFEQTKTLRQMDSPDISEEDKLKMFSKAFDALLKANYEMVCNSIVRVTNEALGVDVTNDISNRRFVLDFLNEMEKTDADLVNGKIKEMSSIGINKTTHIICQKCAHEWDSPIEFDPVTFFSGS